MNISTLEDIAKLEKLESIKYINIDINNPNQDIINYFLEHGQNYAYAETIGDKCGYIYVNHSMFTEAEQVKNNILESLPTNLSQLEQARYLYIRLGSILGYDINIEPDKNEQLNLTSISIVNNLWGSLSTKKVTSPSLVRIYYYFCRCLNINCEINQSDKYPQTLGNRLTINGQTIDTNLYIDLPYIQGHFHTVAFALHNEDENLDRKVGFIQTTYSNKLLTPILQKIDPQSPTFLEDVLEQTQDVLEVQNIKPSELALIYRQIFDEYFPSHPVSINNLYINDVYNNKEHFILFTYGEEHYSYNYNRSQFVNISSYDLKHNIENNKIGIYQNEDMPRLPQYQKV